MKLLTFLKKHIVVVAAACIAVAVLSVAFFAGGSLDFDNTETTAQSSSYAQSTDDTIAYIEETTIDLTDSTTTAENEISSTEEQSSATSEKSKSQAQSSDNDSSSANNQTSQSKNVTDSNSASSKSSNLGSSSSSSSTQKDKYLTDPIPDGKPEPVEPEDQVIENNFLTCTFSISCSTILDNMNDLDPDKVELVPEDGWILKPTKVVFYEGESVYDVLARVCKDNKIHMESSWTPVFNSRYVEGINNIYEIDCGSQSGWMYSVNDWFPNYGCSRYELKQGDVVEWKYTCKGLGADIGGGYAVGG